MSQALEPGTPVRVIGGGFEGLTGRIVQADPNRSYWPHYVAFDEGYLKDTSFGFDDDELEILTPPAQGATP